MFFGLNRNREGEREEKKNKVTLLIAVGYDGHHNIFVYMACLHAYCAMYKNGYKRKHIHFCNKTSSDGHTHCGLPCVSRHLAWQSVNFKNDEISDD